MAHTQDYHRQLPGSFNSNKTELHVGCPTVNPPKFSESIYLKNYYSIWQWSPNREASPLMKMLCRIRDGLILKLDNQACFIDTLTCATTEFRCSL
ncbi:hypothetical protein Dimus_009339 [Dionaea muscipula]